MNPNAQHVQEDDAALVKPGPPNAHATGDSALQPNTPRLPRSEIAMSELNQGNSFVSTTSETSLVPTSTSVTIVGDTIDSGSTVEQVPFLEPRPSYQKLRSLKATGKAENGECRFTTVTETRVVKSILFGKDVEYGLGHRVRTMDLGVYPHDTSTSRLFWSEEYMQIIASTPGLDGFLLHVYEPVDDNLKYAKKTEAAPAETKAEGGGVDKS